MAVVDRVDVLLYATVVGLAFTVKTGVPLPIVSVRVAVPVPDELVAPIVTFDTAAAVGVPVIFPVEVLTLKPAGRPVAL